MDEKRSDNVLVQTVSGPVDSSDLGLTLFHEHIFVDNRGRAEPQVGGGSYADFVWRTKMTAEFSAHLRDAPMSCEDNCVLDDIALAVEELGAFVDCGGRTVIDQTPFGVGRRQLELVDVARQTGLQIVCGAGYYLERLHPPEVEMMNVEDVAVRLTAELAVGENGIRAGIIGEIGISAEFTNAEKKVLRGAGRAQIRSGVPLSVHLPGWHRYGHQVLDILEAEGVDPKAVVLCHMNPSVADPAYHESLGQRGAYLSFDMCGIDWFFSQTGYQAPTDAEVASAIFGLCESGYADQILISCDTFLKMQLHRYGGAGYDHVPRRILPRLQRLGFSISDTLALVTTNPARTFEEAARAIGGPGGEWE